MKNQPYYRLILLLSSFLIIGALLYLYVNGKHEESVRFLIRSTAKGAALLFALAFGAGSMHYFFKARFSAYLLRNRSFLGVAFAIVHTFHLFFLIGLQNSFHPVFTLAKTSSLIGGGAAYILMYMMAVTSLPDIKEKMSAQKWKTLHLIGGYWIWFIFFRSYFNNVMNKNQYHAFFALFVVVMLFRIMQLLHKRWIKATPLT